MTRLQRGANLCRKRTHERGEARLVRFEVNFENVFRVSGSRSGVRTKDQTFHSNVTLAPRLTVEHLFAVPARARARALLVPLLFVLNLWQT